MGRAVPPDPTPNPLLRVLEVFPSLQGESSYAGLPCIFIRLAGCDLSCTYCDTRRNSVGAERTIFSILEEVAGHGLPLVEVTGGEPLLQEAVYPLMSHLADSGKTVLLETSGAHDISLCDRRVVRIVDVKTPSSGECSRNFWGNLEHLRPTDELKFVIGDRGDFDWAVTTVVERGLQKMCPVMFSAVAGKLPLGDLAGWILRSGLFVRLQPRIHDITGLP